MTFSRQHTCQLGYLIRAELFERTSAVRRLTSAGRHWPPPELASRRSSCCPAGVGTSRWTWFRCYVLWVGPNFAEFWSTQEVCVHS